MQGHQTTTRAWRGKHKGARHAQEHLQSATTSLEAFSTSLNCDGDEILTVFDMLAAVGGCFRKELGECPATASGTWAGSGRVGQ